MIQNRFKVRDVAQTKKKRRLSVSVQLFSHLSNHSTKSHPLSKKQFSRVHNPAKKWNSSSWYWKMSMFMSFSINVENNCVTKEPHWAPKSIHALNLNVKMFFYFHRCCHSPLHLSPAWQPSLFCRPTTLSKCFALPGGNWSYMSKPNWESCLGMRNSNRCFFNTCILRKRWENHFKGAMLKNKNKKKGEVKLWQPLERQHFQ